MQEPPSVAKTRRLLNRWSIFGLLILSSLTVIFFVSNALTVNDLVEELEQLRQEKQRLVRQNELLRSEIIALQAPDRITAIATQKLGMVQAPLAPRPLP